jgi:hypothetical protein
MVSGFLRTRAVEEQAATRHVAGLLAADPPPPHQRLNIWALKVQLCAKGEGHYGLLMKVVVRCHGSMPSGF